MKKILAISLLTLLAVSIYAASDNSQQLSVRQTFSQSADISLSHIAACQNIAISGQCQINHNGQTSLFRAILVDENGEEYLVAEFNDLISSEQQVSFNSRCDETAFSSSVKPAKLKIIVVNAQATIDNVTYENNESATRGTDDIAAAKSTRVANEIALYNQAIQREGMLWIAGETSLSNLTYSQKKKIFGATSDSCCWYGLEHYKGGIYSTPSYLANRERSNTTSQYVSKFSWHKRHGINWNTSVKNQLEPQQPDSIGNDGCWTFSAIALAEIYANIYYNTKIDLDLSEQNVISCSDSGTVKEGGLIDYALDYICGDGVVNESCFPFENADLPCNEMCPNPTVYFAGNAYRDYGTLGHYPVDINNENDIKNLLINSGPMAVSINNQNLMNHALLLCGWGTIDINDVLMLVKDGDTTEITTILNNSPYIGQTYWIFKDSFGPNYGNNGYTSMVIDEFNLMSYLYHITGAPFVYGLSSNDIVCEDFDGDGYYNWGIGPKPAYCPPCPDQPDGNDYNPNVGPNNQYGFSQYLADSLADPCIVGPDVMGCETKFAVKNIPENTIVDWYVLNPQVGEIPVVFDSVHEALVVVRQGLTMENNHIVKYVGYTTIAARFDYHGSQMILTHNLYVAGQITPYVNLTTTLKPMVGRNITYMDSNCPPSVKDSLVWIANVPGVGIVSDTGSCITVRPSRTGILRVSVTNPLACDASDNSFSFSSSVVGGQIILSSNPVDDLLEFEIIKSSEDIKHTYSIDVYNSTVRMTDSIRCTQTLNQLNTSSFVNGCYVIRLFEDGILVDTKNFIVKH